MLQHGAYTLLIDSCYDREVFPTFEQAVEWTWAATEAEVEAVKFILNRFFTLDKDGCYVQQRILEELLHYHKNADTNKRIADEREAKRRGNRTNREQNVDEAPPNHKPLTINQEPLTKEKPQDKPANDLFESFWKAYPKKQGKDAAKKAFIKRKVGKELSQEMIAALNQQKKTDQWLKNGGQFIPNPATWINEGRWQDEIFSVQQSNLPAYS
jgi:uncharacterized protein YdaU (DUF1376 family)